MALVLLTVVTAGSIVAADRALSDADGNSLEQHRVERASDALVTDSPLTTAQGYVAPSLANATNASELATAIPSLRGVSFRVRFDGRDVATRGPVTDGVTVSRSVVVVENRTVTEDIELGNETATTLDGRTDEIRVDVAPVNNTTVRTVRIGDRVVLHEPGGIDGSYVVAVSSYTTPEVRVDAVGDPPEGTVTATATLFETRTAQVEVTVDA